MRIFAEIRSALRPAFVLLLLATVPALVATWWHPQPAALDDDERVSVYSVREARALAERAPVLWVDARSASAFAEATLPGAVPLRHDQWEDLLPGFVDAWQPGQIVVVFCDGGDCATARSVAVRLKREFSLEQVGYLEGGWTTWRAER